MRVHGTQSKAKMESLHPMLYSGKTEAAYEQSLHNNTIHTIQFMCANTFQLLIFSKDKKIYQIHQNFLSEILYQTEDILINKSNVHKTQLSANADRQTNRQIDGFSSLYIY